MNSTSNVVVSPDLGGVLVMSYSQAVPLYVAVLTTIVCVPLLVSSAAHAADAKSARGQSISILVRADLQQGELSAPGTSIDWWLREDIVQTSPQMADGSPSVFSRSWLKDDQLRGSH
ncbi:hypothetical protein [Rhizobium cauense]|uniref:hypothetical protein n=1 Tax=Rhizobium cauense TaxID=1166683 RepID=UPI0030B87FB4